MPPNVRLLILLVLVGACAIQVRSEEFIKEIDESDHSEVLPASLVEIVGGLPTASVNLGAVQAGKLYEFTVALTNQTGHAIQFSRISTTCACQRVSPQSGVIPPGEKLQFRFQLDLPSHPRGQLSFGYADLVGLDNESVGRVEYRYSEPLYIGFRTEMILMEQKEGQRGIKIPVALQIGEEVAVEQYQITIPEIGWRKEVAGQMDEVELDAELADQVSSRLTLRLQRTFQQSVSTVDELDVLIDRRSKVDVSPKVIRLSLSDSGKRLTGSTFVRLETVEPVQRVVASFRLDGRSYRLNYEKLSDQFGRLKLSLSSQNFIERSGKTLPLTLKVSTLGEEIKQPFWIVFPHFNVSGD